MINIRATTDFVRHYGYGKSYGNKYIEISNASFVSREDGELKNSFIITRIVVHEVTDFDRLYKNKIGSFI